MLNKCYSNFNIECRPDETDRSCFAGALNAAAIIKHSPYIKLTKAKKQEQFLSHAINNSKLLTKNTS